MRVFLETEGYSLIEMVFVMSILGGLFLIMSDFYANELVSYNRNFTQTILQNNVKQALETVGRDLREASSVQDSNVWGDPNRPGGWQSTPTAIVLAEPALDSSDNVIYADPTHTTIKTNDVIYFVGSDNSLYRRRIANPDVNNAEPTTCPAASASPSCPPDGKVVENIASLSILYFDTSNNNVPSSPYSAVYSVQLTMTQSLTSFGKTYTTGLTSQSSLRNR